MHTIKLEEVSVELYDNIDDMPAKRYFNFIYYLSLSMGIDVGNLPTYFSNLIKYIDGDQKQEAFTEVRNMQIAMHNGLSRIDLSSLCWAQLIHKTSDRDSIDYADERLYELINELSDKGLTRAHIEPVIHTIKKKWMPNFVEEDY